MIAHLVPEPDREGEEGLVLEYSRSRMEFVDFWFIWICLSSGLLGHLTFLGQLDLNFSSVFIFNLQGSTHAFSDWDQCLYNTDLVPKVCSQKEIQCWGLKAAQTSILIYYN